MLAKPFLLATASLMACAAASAQSEAYYAARMVAEQNKFTGRPITFTFDGVPLSLPDTQVVDHILAGMDLQDLAALNVVRAADGHDNDASEVLSVAQIEDILGELKKTLDASAAEGGAPDAFPRGGDATGVEGMVMPSQGAVLDALAQVIVSRVKEELAMAYFDKMAVKMDSVRVLKHACATGKPPLRMCTLTELMPATQMIFQQSRDHISSHAGATFKAAFVDDLEHFPAHFASSYEKGLVGVEEPACAGTLTNLDFGGFMAGRIIEGIAEQRGWMDVLEGLSSTDVKSATWQKRATAIDLTLRLLESMKDTSGEKFVKLPLARWTDAQLHAYMGLLLANPQVHADLKTLGLDTKVTANLATVRQLVGEASAMVRTITELNELIERSPKPEEDKGERVARYAHFILDLILQGDNALGALAGQLASVPDPDRLLPSGFPHYFTVAADLRAAIVNEDYGKVSLQVLRLLNAALPKDNILDHDLVKLVTLAADIAEVGDGDVKAIFEAAIMPVGSYRVKQSTSFSATLNAYPGVFVGNETLQGTNSTKTFLGVSGPIGIALSTSRGNERTLRASNSLMLGFIDIGALLSYRLDSEDSVSANPDVTFATVLAPGLFFMHGFKESPLSLGIGVQYAPRLRTVTADAIDLAPQDALRIGVTLAVDIPLFPLALKRRQVGGLVEEIKDMERSLANCEPDGGRNDRCAKKLRERIKCRQERLAKSLED